MAAANQQPPLNSIFSVAVFHGCFAQRLSHVLQIIGDSIGDHHDQQAACAVPELSGCGGVDLHLAGSERYHPDCLRLRFGIGAVAPNVGRPSLWGDCDVHHSYSRNGSRHTAGAIEEGCQEVCAYCGRHSRGGLLGHTAPGLHGLPAGLGERPVAAVPQRVQWPLRLAVLLPGGGPSHRGGHRGLVGSAH